VALLVFLSAATWTRIVPSNLLAHWPRVRDHTASIRAWRLAGSPSTIIRSRYQLMVPCRRLKIAALLH
jgi:hypothetical protein